MNKKNETPKVPVVLDPQRMPRHVAIIMDGNGRWAKNRRFGRIRGHRRGVEVVIKIVRASRDLGVRHLTLYAFSDENWQRPSTEVKALMELLKRFLLRERREMMENGVRLGAIGCVEKLPAGVRKVLDDTIDMTRDNNQVLLTLALSYGGRQEIVQAARCLAEKVSSGQIAACDIDQAAFQSALYTSAMPDPDLLIRTSGEMRISNFLLWQLAYTEIYITETLWPDFSVEDYRRAIAAYQQRERRFGKTSAQLGGRGEERQQVKLREGAFIQ